MTSENYRQLLNNEFEAKEMAKEDFDNTLMHFAMLYHKEQCAINGVVGQSGKLPNRCSVCGRTDEERLTMTSMCGVSACPY